MKKLIGILLAIILIFSTPVHASTELAHYEAMKGYLSMPLIVPNKPDRVWTDEEFELLAHVINAEGGAATYVSDQMCYYIGSVVLNRIDSDYFPNNIFDVVYQPGQYACVRDRNWNVPIAERCYEIAEELIDEGSQLPSDYVFQAQFRQGRDGIKVQNMWFCRK